MKSEKFTDCVWYSKPQRAGGRALEMSVRSAEPMFVIKDKKSMMFGVGAGSKAPAWASDASEFEMICVIRPTEH